MTEVRKKDDDTQVVDSVKGDDGKEYVIAYSMNHQSEIARNSRWIKWLLLAILLGGMIAGTFLVALYVKLDTLNVLSII